MHSGRCLLQHPSFFTISRGGDPVIYPRDLDREPEQFAERGRVLENKVYILFLGLAGFFNYPLIQFFSPVSSFFLLF